MDVTGSQNSSPANSPATFQASSAEEDSSGPPFPASAAALTSASAMTSGATSSASASAAFHAAKKSKILKRSEKPRVVLVRNDHGVMEYRRASGVGGSGAGSDGRGPQIIRTVGHRRNLSKRLLTKQAAAAASATSAATHPHNASCVGSASSPSTASHQQSEAQGARSLLSAFRTLPHSVQHFKIPVTSFGIFRDLFGIFSGSCGIV